MTGVSRATTHGHVDRSADGDGCGNDSGRSCSHRSLRRSVRRPTTCRSVTRTRSGYQPGKGATPGYATYVARHTGLTLANFGCAGATTTSLLTTVGCPAVLPHTAGGMTYPTTTQIAAATAFIAAHKGHVGLITVSIGGNDVVPCVPSGQSHHVRRHGGEHDQNNVTSIASQLRAAAGAEGPDHRLDVSRRDPRRFTSTRPTRRRRGDQPGQPLGRGLQVAGQPGAGRSPTPSRSARSST